MKNILVFWLVILILLGSGCTVAPTPAGPTAAPVSVARPTSLRIEISATADIGDIPRLIAIETMRAQGYTVETLALADTTATILAMEKGDLDFANIANANGWAAIQKGLPIATVIDDSANPTIIAARKDIKQCADLQGKHVAMASLTGGQIVMLNRYLESKCPGTKPEYLVVAGKDNRLAAVLSGELDAATMDMADLSIVDSKRQGDVSALVVFAKEFPGLTATSHFARRELIEKYPDTVKAWLRALLDARRRIQDPQILAQECVKRLGMAPDLAQTSAAATLGQGFWDLNGRYTPEIVQQNVDFFIEAGNLKAGLKADAVADLTFLNGVLSEIGRK